MKPERVLIVGGGIGGLTAALALGRAGYRVAVYEQAPEFSEIGAGIMLTPNATRVLRHLGLEAALDRAALRPPASVYRRFDDASVIGDAPLAEAMETAYGAPYFHIHRSDLLDVLLAAVRAQGAAELSAGRMARDCSQEGGEVTVQFSNGDAAVGDLLLACDGIRSTLRGRLLAGAEPRFRGQVAWRSLVPADGLPERVTARESVVWIGRDRHIVQYVLRGGSLVNYVAIAVQDQWTGEGWTRPAKRSELRAGFAGWHEDVQSLLEATPAGALYKWGLFDRDPLEQWVYGRIALLGDSVLVHSGAGGVGLLLIQMCKALGAYVYSTVSTEAKAELARGAGADHVILYTQQDFAAEISKATDGAGLQAVFDAVGKDTFDGSIACLAPRGYMVLYGQASGAVPPVDPRVLGNGSKFLTRPGLGDYTANRAELDQRASAVLGWVQSGELKLRVEHHFALSDAGEAHRQLAGRATTGKIILTP